MSGGPLRVLAAYFNPRGYHTKRALFDRFVAGITGAGAPLLVVEGVFEGREAECHGDYETLRVPCRDVLWQKERLLNAGLAALPSDCAKVAWLDADLVFEDAGWADATARLLDERAVVQPFSNAIRLPRGHARYLGQGEAHESFAATLESSPHLLAAGRFEDHGHTGYAWAAHAGWLRRHGLFDECVAGGADHLMAHAFAGDYATSPCVERLLGTDTPLRSRFERWARAAHDDLPRATGSTPAIGAVPGTVLHLWHGDTANRRYVARNRELVALGFDPERDLRREAGGAWSWSGANPAVSSALDRYFTARREDGEGRALVAADTFEPAADLCVVTSYFNPHGYRRRRDNYARFIDQLARSRQPHLVVEAAFEGQDFTLAPGPNVLQIRARDVMWQKERLLNFAVSRLPKRFRKIAWLDCDLVFVEPAWAVDTSRLLDEHAVVQPFERAVRLPRDRVSLDEDEANRLTSNDLWRSYAAVHADDPAAHREGHFAAHGHTGFAWAARRELLDDPGLYDACLSGSGDHLMAHVFSGDVDGPCVRRTFSRVGRIHRRNPPSAWERHFLDWAVRMRLAMRGGGMGCARGTVLHLWHGDPSLRQYSDRNRELGALDFDPALDLRLGSSGAWEWARERPELRDWAVQYFPRRNEDGDGDGDGDGDKDGNGNSDEDG